MLTASGRAFIFILTFSLFVCWWTQARLAYFISALLTSALFISYLSFRFSLLNVECLRRCPTFAYEDDVLKITLSLRNKGKFTEDTVCFSDLFPPEITNTKKDIFINELPKNAGFEFSYQGKCLKRGIYILGPCVLTKYDFFGLFKKEKRLYPENRLVVFPGVFRVNFFPLHLHSSSLRYGDMVVRRPGEYEEFYSIREYAKEDGLRKIHWPLSAKHDKLIVRHFEQSSSYQCSVVIDLNKINNIGEGRDTTLEYAVKIAASICGYLIKRNGSVQLLAYGDKPILSTFGKSREHYLRIMEMLSGLKANSDIEFSAALARLSPLIPPSSSLIFFVLDKDKKSQILSNSLAAKKDIFVAGIVMDSSSFINHRRLENSPKVSRESSHIVKYHIGYGDSLERAFHFMPSFL